MVYQEGISNSENRALDNTTITDNRGRQDRSNLKGRFLAQASPGPDQSANIVVRLNQSTSRVRLQGPSITQIFDFPILWRHEKIHCVIAFY